MRMPNYFARHLLTSRALNTPRIGKKMEENNQFLPVTFCCGLIPVYGLNVLTGMP